jgi:hypothetical protein
MTNQEVTDTIAEAVGDADNLAISPSGNGN